jgi:hypothetical protein
MDTEQLQLRIALLRTQVLYNLAVDRNIVFSDAPVILDEIEQSDLTIGQKLAFVESIHQALHEALYAPPPRAR